jgi:hypothetical protein
MAGVLTRSEQPAHAAESTFVTTSLLVAYNVAQDREELRLLLDFDNALTPIPLHLHRGGLTESIVAMREETERQAADERAAPLITFLQRVIGYTLTGSTREQCLFILHGKTKTGKST